MSFQLFDLLPAVYRIRDAAIAQSLTLLTPAEQTTLAALQLLQSSSALLSADQQAQLDELLAKASRGPLQSLLMLVQEQIAAVEYDIEQLYDDQFIETCAPWVIPYIGDLIGYQSVKGISSAIDNPRSRLDENSGCAPMLMIDSALSMRGRSSFAFFTMSTENSTSMEVSMPFPVGSPSPIRAWPSPI